jgi:hypothetical protein
MQSALGRVAQAQQIVPGSPTLDTAMPDDQEGQALVARHLALFDRVDFEAWNNQDWDLFRQLHSDHVHVEGGGAITDGIDAHVAWAQALLKSYPSKILAHPIRIGASNWTTVTGLLPSGTMITLARWEDDRIAEEYLWVG